MPLHSTPRPRLREGQFWRLCAVIALGLHATALAFSPTITALKSTLAALNATTFTILWLVFRRTGAVSTDWQPDLAGNRNMRMFIRCALSAAS